jgi:hypothetical protein
MHRKIGKSGKMTFALKGHSCFLRKMVFFNGVKIKNCIKTVTQYTMKSKKVGK